MSDRTKFHLDEHIWPQVAQALRRHGIDVTTTNEAGLRKKDDQAHMDFVRREGRIMITKDADFLRYAKTVPDHPGVVSCRRKGLTLGQAIRGLLLIAEVLTPQEMLGHVEYL